MICRDLQTVPAPPLPSELTLRPVRRLAIDPPGGVPLAQAVVAACRAEQSSDARALAEHLRSLPRAFALWARPSTMATPSPARRASPGSGRWQA